MTQEPLYTPGTIVRPAGLDSHVTLETPFRDPPSEMFPEGTWIYPCKGSLHYICETYVAEVVTQPNS